MADFPRKHAKTICFFGRRPVDISAGRSAASLTRKTFRRPIIITNSDFRFIVAEQLRECNVEADIVLGADAAQFRIGGGDCGFPRCGERPRRHCVILPPTMCCGNSDAFHQGLRQAAAVAADGRIVTFGINRNYSRHELRLHKTWGKTQRRDSAVSRSIVEKPDAQTAGRYVAEHYLWNSGNFAFRADVMLPRSPGWNRK